MSDRDRHGHTDPDDWFAGLDEDAPMSGRRAHVTPPPSLGSQQLRTTDELLELAEPVEATTSNGVTVTLGALLAATAIAVAVIVVAALALTGVFSNGGKRHATSAASTATVLTSSRNPTTTTSTSSATPLPSRPAFPLPTATLRPGDRGAQVRLLQRALRELGYLNRPADGIYGNSTQNALTALQRVSLLTADGILGPRTLHALEQGLNKARLASP